MNRPGAPSISTLSLSSHMKPHSPPDIESNEPVEHSLPFQSSFLGFLAIRADRRPSGVAMLPKSLEPAFAFRGGVVVIATFLDFLELFCFLMDKRESPITARNPNKAI